MYVYVCEKAGGKEKEQGEKCINWLSKIIAEKKRDLFLTAIPV